MRNSTESQCKASLEGDAAPQLVNQSSSVETDAAPPKAQGSRSCADTTGSLPTAVFGLVRKVPGEV